jgi:hypothetical protein
MTSAEAIALIEAATEPGDLFSGDAGRCYRRLARLTHPDINPGGGRAADAFAKLAGLWQLHQGIYWGIGGRAIAKGDIANLYMVRHGVQKLVRDPADNDLMRREAVALTRIGDQVDPRLLAYFPRLVEAQRQQDPRSGAVRLASVLDRLDGFCTLAQVRAAFPDGVDPRDAAWMWRRLLAAIGAAHRAGVIHGAVLPEHVMIHPAEHGLVLVDWCYSSTCYSNTGVASRLPAVVGRFRDWYPAEVLAGQPVGPDLDIWLAARCMTDLIGAGLPRPMASFATGCQLANPSRRPADAWQVLSEFDEVLDRLYGPRKFRPFAIPA